MKPKTPIRPTERKVRSFRRSYGIADNYRIYQPPDDAPKVNLLTVIAALLSPMMTLLSGTAVKSMLIKAGQDNLAPLFETLYEKQLLHQRLPDKLIRAYLPQIAEHKLPVNIYHVLDNAIIHRDTGTLTQSADGHYQLQNNRPIPLHFNLEAVRHIFPAPQWAGERVCIVIRA